MTAVELLPPGEATPDNDEWHRLRQAGITASEIAAVMGISPWESPFSLYWRKANGWVCDDNDIMSTGRHLEDAIADWWMAECDPLENLVAARAGLYAHPDRPYQLATPDRLLGLREICGSCDAGLPMSCFCNIVSKPIALLECKWVAYSWDGWGEPGTDDIPVQYRAQCLWQLDVLGVDEVHVAALGPGGFRAYGPIVRDDNDLDVMRDAGAEFARRLAEQDPPDLDAHTATLTTLKRLHPSVGEGAVEVPYELVKDYFFARITRKDAEERIAECEAQIRAALGSTYARATHDGKLVASRSVYDQERIDVARLRAEQPEIAAAYTTKTTVDRLNPGRVSHGT
jgi:putative phage-type endonuclease